MAAFFPTTVVILLQLMLDRAAGRDVLLPAGPLFRVAGFPVSLPCAVTGYEGPRTQEFEWFLYRDDANGNQIGIVSSRDQGFPYAPFQGRVRSGEVRVERDSGDKVRLVLQRLRAEDQGTYECYTPTTDSTYQGNYSAKVAVRVIPDTLQISITRALTGPPLPEGAGLTLTCSAGVRSDEHTHLSITFGKRGAGGEASAAREIISLDRALAVTPGSHPSYRRRYEDGEISLEKRSGGGGGLDAFTVRLRALRPEDSGSYFCEASQWIRDPDRSWQRIAQRTLDIGNLTVQRLSESLSVTSDPSGGVNLQPGAPLALTCRVSGLPGGGAAGLLVQWLKRGADAPGGAEVEVARLSPDGAVSWGADPDRGAGGALEKVSEGRYALRLFSARPSDAGVYRCSVSVYAGRRDPAPSATATFTQGSEGVSVTLKTKEVRVTAVAQLQRGPLLKRGSTITLLCNVTVTTTGPARLQVGWLRRPLPDPLIVKGDRADAAAVLAAAAETPSLVATLTHEGVAQILANGSEVSVDRVAPQAFRLRVHAAADEDQGLYECRAQVWGQDPHGGWYDTQAAFQSPPVTVYLYSRAADLLLIPLVVGVSSALLVGVVIISAVTCCFMKRLARQRPVK